MMLRSYHRLHQLNEMADIANLSYLRPASLTHRVLLLLR
jgi:hypothetical protein